MWAGLTTPVGSLDFDKRGGKPEAAGGDGCFKRGDYVGVEFGDASERMRSSA